MADPQTPPAPKESPLGVDTPEKELPNIPLDPDEPQPQQENKKEEPEVTDSPKFTQEEIAALQKDAEMFRIIKTHPELTEKVLDFIRNKAGNGEIPKPNSESKPDSTPDNGMAKELAELKEQYKVLAAQNMIASFFAENPEAKNHRKEMGELLGKHPTFSLQEAYDFVRSKAKAPASPNQGIKTPEGSGNTPRLPGSREDIQRKINDPKETPDFDTAVELAMKEAVRSVGQE